MESAEPPGAARASQLVPEIAWKAMTEAPLSGCALARETSSLLAWDESRQLYLFNSDGQAIATERAPAPIQCARISDDGSLVALLIGGNRLVLLNSNLEPLSERAAPPGATILDVDSHGRYIVVATRQGENHFFTRHGKSAGRFTSRQPLTHVRFIPALPLVIGAAGYGVLVCMELEGGKTPGTLKASPLWEERLMSNLGALESTGDGSMILTSCFNLGIQRYTAKGQNEGSYHLGGTVILAVPDFPGRCIAVASQEGQLAILNRSGNVRWRTEIECPPLGLVIDALGRYLIYGLPSGELIRLNLDSTTPKRPASSQPSESSTSADSTFRKAAWKIQLAKSADEAEVSVVAVQADPERVAVLTKGNKFRVFDSKGKECGDGPELRGIGRILRVSKEWIAAATDRQITLHNSHDQSFHQPDLDLVQVTHLAIRPESYGMAIVQERDRIGRATVTGRWVWRKDLKRPVEDLVIGPHGLTAYTTDDGVFQILDAAGEEPSRPPFRADEPLLLVDAPHPPTGTPTVAFITLSPGAAWTRCRWPDSLGITNRLGSLANAAHRRSHCRACTRRKGSCLRSGWPHHRAGRATRSSVCADSRSIRLTLEAS